MESLCLAIVLAPNMSLESRALVQCSRADAFMAQFWNFLLGAGMECMYSSRLLARNIREDYVVQYICLIVILVFVLEEFLVSSCYIFISKLM